MKNREEILRELREIAPELAMLDKDQPADVPASYFTTFPMELMQKIRVMEIASELSTVAPELAKLEKVATYGDAPLGYFQANASAILGRIKAAESGKSVEANGWLSSLNRYFEKLADVVFKPKYSVAFAGFATTVILAVMLVMKVEAECADLDCQMAQISNEELNSYFDTHADEFSSDLLDYNPDENPEVRSTMMDISDEELNEYLN